MKPEPWCCRGGGDPCCIDIAETVDYSLIGHTSLSHAASLLAPGWWREYQVPWPEDEIGKWAVRRYEIKPTWADFHNARHPDPGLHVTPGHYTKLVRDGWEVVMSDTQAEIQDHLEFIDRAHGRVLMNGLGLGVSLNAILRKNDGECVEHVDVVEIEQDVIDLIGPHFADDPRVTIHHADAYSIKWPAGTSWHVAWHDIWAFIDPDDRENHAKIVRRYQNRVLWQGCWKDRWIRGFSTWLRDKEAEENVAVD